MVPDVTLLRDADRRAWADVADALSFVNDSGWSQAMCYLIAPEKVMHKGL